MAPSIQFGPILERFRETYPIGFAIALHIRFTSPRFLLQAYAPDWVDHYTRESMAIDDPTVRWGFSHTGAIRWEDLPIPNDAAAKVMADAAAHGLLHGFTVAVGDGGGRSFGSFARSDRAPSAAEIASAEQDLAELHRMTDGADALPRGVEAALRKLSITLTH